MYSGTQTQRRSTTHNNSNKLCPNKTIVMIKTIEISIEIQWVISLQQIKRKKMKNAIKYLMKKSKDRSEKSL
jgi:hypothetical protein